MKTMSLPKARTVLAFVGIIGFISVTAGFFIILYGGDKVSLPDGDLGKQIIGMLGLIVGTWISIALNIVGFHFNTSQSSQDKNEIVKKALEK